MKFKILLLKTYRRVGLKPSKSTFGADILTLEFDASDGDNSSFGFVNENICLIMINC